jgi:hypothetical protein
MQPWLDKNPLIVDDAVARDLIAQVNKDDDKLLASIADDLPIFKVGLYGLEADGGYLGIGINAE